MATTLNPSDKSGNVTLSGGNLTATTNNVAVTGGVRSVDRLLNTKFYFEATLTSVTNTFAGIATAAASMTVNPTTTAATGISGVFSTGIIYASGTNTGTSLGGFTAGQVVGIAVDGTASLIWIRNASTAGNWNANAANNPATGVGGISMSAGGLAIYGYVGYGTANSGNAITANFGDSAFTGTVPSGFTSGLPVGTPPLNAAATQIAIEQWAQGTPGAQLTQAAIEMWAPGGTTTPLAVMTTISLEQWASVALAAAGQQARAMILA